MLTQGFAILGLSPKIVASRKCTHTQFVYKFTFGRNFELTSCKNLQKWKKRKKTPKKMDSSIFPIDKTFTSLNSDKCIENGSLQVLQNGMCNVLFLQKWYEGKIIQCFKTKKEADFRIKKERKYTPFLLQLSKIRDTLSFMCILSKQNICPNFANCKY